ncbi:hypothetical protein [Chitinophaga polysaccharea]|uniref:hypothetical protein n=1 Tax=Chitinophaga polysaccharea TaxID=1293035 RepID=UPI00115B40FF|nr:hypothetical protein [Chitinophaga polysaccharea]
MKYQIGNIPLLKKILWADCLLGGGTAGAGHAGLPGGEAYSTAPLSIQKRNEVLFFLQIAGSEFAAACDTPAVSLM